LAWATALSHSAAVNSLEVWLALTLMVGTALTGRSRWRVIAWLASGQLLVALTLTLLGHGFYRADLW
jgi:hypothetical protein